MGTVGNKHCIHVRLNCQLMNFMIW